MIPLLEFILLTDPLGALPPHHQRLGKRMYDFYIAKEQRYQLNHSSITELHEACDRIGVFTKNLMIKYKFEFLWLTILPSKPDPALAKYDGIFADNVIDFGRNVIRVEWSHTREDRVKSTIVHEFSHALRRKYDDDSKKLAPLASQILHEGLAETLVSLECGPAMVLHNNPLSFDRRQEIIELIECEFNQTPLTPDQELLRDELIDGEDKYAFGFQLMSDLMSSYSYSDILKMPLFDFLELAIKHLKESKP